MRFRTIFLLTASLFFFPFCKTTKRTDAPKPAEQYIEAPITLAYSTISIPVNISIADLVKSINSRLAGPLYEDYSFDDNGGDGLMLKALKSRDVELYISGNTLKYRVPISIWLKKKLFVGSAEAQGEIALNFTTNFQIKEDWSIATQTSVEYHEWLQKPVLKTGLGDLSIESIANLFLNRSKKDMSQSIDKLVKEQLNLRPHLEAAWTGIQEPTLLSPDYQMWVKSTPVSIAMTPLTTTWDKIQTKIAVEVYNDVTFGAKPTFRENSTLPDLKLIPEAPDDFQMRFTTDVPFPEAERLAKNMMVGQVFGEGKQKVKVENIELWGNNDKVVVNTELSGAFKGKIYFIGKPTFNAAKNQIEIANLDFHLDTKNFLQKSGAWILKGVLKNQMAKAMTFPLDENLTLLKKSVNETLTNYIVQPGVTMTGLVDEIKVEGTSVTPTSILVNLYAKGKINVDVKGL